MSYIVIVKVVNNGGSFNFHLIQVIVLKEFSDKIYSISQSTKCCKSFQYVIDEGATYNPRFN